MLDKSINEVSGGERKRSLIAIELALNKKILILDEPTSDLDSHLALKLITFLKKIAVANDIAVILTIHQPSDQLFKKLDQVTFILEGKMIYSGETSQLIPFLTSHAIVKPAEWTISDFIFEAFYNKSEFEEFSHLKEHIDIFVNQSVVTSDLIVSSSNLSKKGHPSAIEKSIDIRKFCILLKRQLREVFTQKNTYISIFLMSLFFSFYINKVVLGFEFPIQTIAGGEKFFSAFTILFDSATIEKIESSVYQIAKLQVQFDVKVMLVTNLMLLLGLCAASGFSIFAMKDQFINEISRNVYNSTTLYAVSFVLQIIMNSIIFTVVLACGIPFKIHKFITAIDLIFIVLMIIATCLTSTILDVVRLHRVVESSKILKTALFIFRFVGLIPGIAFGLYDGIIKKFPGLEIFTKVVFAFLTLLTMPSHFVNFIARKVSLDQFNSHSGLQEQIKNCNKVLTDTFCLFFCKNALGYKSMFSLLIISTCAIILTTIIITARIFNPRIAIKI